MSFPLLSESRTRFLGHLSGESLPQAEVLELFGDFSIDLAGDSGAVSLCLGLVASEVQKGTHRSRASEPAVTGQQLLFPISKPAARPEPTGARSVCQHQDGPRDDARGWPSPQQRPHIEGAGCFFEIQAEYRG